MTIHAEHPFADPPDARTPLRRFRGRAPSAVTVWAAAVAGRRAGWTVSSFLVADGDPAEVLGVVDEESPLADLLSGQDALTVNLLAPGQQQIADVFAGLAPAPGGTFTAGSWSTSDWGPVLAGSAGWLGVRLAPEPLAHAGWGLLVRGTVEHVELGPVPEAGLLAHVRGDYQVVSVGRRPGDDHADTSVVGRAN